MDVVQLSHASTTAELTHSDNYPTFLRTLPADPYQGGVVADLMKKTFGWTRAIAFATSDVLGTDSITEFSYTANKLGIDVVHTATFTPGTTDFSSFLATVTPFDARVFVFFITAPADASALLMQGFAAGVFSSKSTFFFSAALSGPPTYAAVLAKYGPSALQGSFKLVPMLNFWKTSPAGQAFLKRWVAQADTVTIDPNGRQICNNATDDTGAYLYRYSPSAAFPKDPKTCAGTRFSKLALDGFDGFVNHFHAFFTAPPLPHCRRRPPGGPLGHFAPAHAYA